MTARIRAFLTAILISIATLVATPAQADVKVTFYTREFGAKFPHAFFTTKGTLSNGKKVDGNYGFTAKKVGPALLFGSVEGEVQPQNAQFIAKSNAYFSVTLDDKEYSRLMRMVQKWRDIPQKSYSLNKRNCVHFIADAIQTIGFKTNAKTKYWKKPTSFVKEVMKLNPSLGL